MASTANLQAAAQQARQHAQQSSEERTERKANLFDDFEKRMPSIEGRFKCMSPVDNVTSYLGKKNPFAHKVNTEATVWILDNAAFRRTTFYDSWQAEYVVAYFLKGSGHDASRVVSWVADQLQLSNNPEAQATIRQRIQPFLDAILPAHKLEFRPGSEKPRELGPGDRSGVSSEIVRLSGKYKPGDIVENHPVDAHIANSVMAAGLPRTYFNAPTGWAVVSDIDDTIKKTLTPSPLGILRTTFVDTPEPIAGQPELYKYLNEKLGNPAWFYLTASPYNLFPFLRTFLQQYYPLGPMILRDASWMNLGGFLASLTMGTQSYKVDRLEKIHTWFPKRKFLCVGDSTQTDPETYGEMYRKYPDWIGAIYIRRVSDVAEMDIQTKNADSRFTKAFKDVPKEVWHVFDDPRELYERVDALVAKGPGA